MYIDYAEKNKISKQMVFLSTPFILIWVMDDLEYFYYAKYQRFYADHFPNPHQELGSSVPPCLFVQNKDGYRSGLI